MSRNLRLQVVLNAVDKLTRPFRSAQESNKKLASAIRQSRDTLKSLNQQAGQIEGFRKAKQQLTTTQQAYQAATQRAAALAREMSATANPTQRQTEALRKAQQEAAKLKNKFGELQQSVQRQRNELQANGISTNQLGQAQRRLNSDISRTTQQLQRQEQQLRRSAEQERRMANARSSYQSTMGTRNKIAGNGAAMTATGVGLLYGAKKTLGAGFDFEKGMSGVQALTRLDNNSPELKALTEQARQLGATTSFTANDVAGGMGFLAMAGYDPDKIKKSIPSMLDLAKAAGMDDSLAEVADIASNIQSAYKIPADEMKRVADVLTFGFTTSNTDLRMLGETMKYVGPAAQSAGQDFESMVATVGLLGNVGIQGSQAGTSLRMSLMRLAAQPKAASKALRELGVSISDSAGRMKSMPIMLSEIDEAFKKKGISGIGNVKKMAYVKDIFGVESSAAMLELLDKQGEIDPDKRIDAYIERINNQKNTASQVATTKANNLDGDIRNMVSAFEDVAITIYDDIRQPLRDIVNQVTEITRKVGDWAKQNPEIVKWTAAVTLGLGAVLTVLGGVSLMIAAMLGPLAMAKLSLSVLGIKGSGFLSLLLKPLKLVGSAFMWLGKILLANPIILIITAIAAAAYLIYKYWDNIAPYVKKLWDKVTQLFSSAWNWIKSFLMKWTIVGLIAPHWDKITSYANTVWEAVKQTFSQFWDWVKYFILNWTTPGLIYQHWDKITYYANVVWEAVKQTFSAFWEWVKGFILNWTLPGLIYKHWDSIVAVTLKMWATIKKTISDKWDEIVNNVKNLPENFKQVGGLIIDSLKNGILEKWEALKAQFAEIKKMATDLMPDWMLSDETRALRASNQVTVIKASMKSAGMFDSGGIIPRGQFGIVGERGAEIVEGPARVTSRRNTAAMAMAAAMTLGTLSQPVSAKPIHPYAVNAGMKQSAPTSKPVPAPVINIYPQPTQSAQDIGQEVARQIDAYYRRQQAAQRSNYRDSEDF
ncbi:phage tail tape measure protein [Providencia stuartii]|uniref:phage tail tape measure protein n=1 Tax=Providencia stuartii TaxID=588 RepID=UPI0028C0ABC3|nr:phage tail tape measure protein [Providencia stuartii]MDT7048758.1 phage tail tape measure protein [Providencia stuartii]